MKTAITPEWSEHHGELLKIFTAHALQGLCASGHYTSADEPFCDELPCEAVQIAVNAVIEYRAAIARWTAPIEVEA